jgi:hypothetical protein
MGLENMTARSIGELLWAIGWEPYFGARRIERDYDGNEFVELVVNDKRTEPEASQELPIKTGSSTVMRVLENA